MKERCNIALIPLTQGKYAIIDIWNCEWLNQWKWYAQKDGIKYKKIYRAVRQQKINEIQNKRKQISMGRFILNFPDFDVDHVDGNPLNNCESNLRVVTCRQNCQNMHNQRTSSYPGVSWNKNREKWQCHIRTKTKQEYLGSLWVDISSRNLEKVRMI